MAQILGLLLAAVQLLTVVQSNPQLPQSVKDQAINLANYSIAVANQAIANQNVEVDIVNAPIVQPYVPPVNLGAQPTMPEVKKELIPVVIGNSILVAYTENREKISGVEVSISTDSSGYFTTIIKDPDDPTGRGNKSVEGSVQITGTWRGSGPGFYEKANVLFGFMPEKSGEITFTVSANGLTATTTKMVYNK